MPTIDQSWAVIDAELTRLESEGGTPEEYSALFQSLRDYDAQVRDEFGDKSWPDQVALLNRNAARLFKIHNFLRLNVGFYSGNTQAFIDSVEADINALFESFFSAGATNLYYYLTNASMQADVANRDDGQVAVVLKDEAKGNRLAYYERIAGAWSYLTTTPIPEDFSYLPTNATPDGSAEVILREGGVTYRATLDQILANALSGDTSLAVLDENENVTGLWNFTQPPTIGGSALHTYVQGLIVLTPFSTDDLSEGASNFYWTQGRFDTAYAAALAASDTDDLAEGVTNLYYTQARFDAALAASDTDDVAEGATNLYWTEGRFNTSFSAKSTSDLTEGANLYWTQTRFDTALTASDTDDLSEGAVNLYYTAARFNAAFSGKSTSDLAEGTNLYFTDERVDDRVMALLQPGNAISWSYDDLSNTLTPTVSLGSFDTDDLAEGATNKYFTDERVDDRVASLLVSGTGLSFAYDDFANTLTPTVTLAPFTTTDLAEGDNKYWTQTRFDLALAAASTTELAEGTNLYYTDARVQAWMNGTRTITGAFQVYNGWTFNTAPTFTTAPLFNAGGRWQQESADQSTQSGYTSVWAGNDNKLHYKPHGLSRITLATEDSTWVAADITDLSTTTVPEGTNLYYTQARFNSAFAGKTTSDLTEGSNLYWTQGRFDTAFSGKTTDSLAEGVTNVYFTAERVDDRVTALLQPGTGITWSYNDGANTLTPTVSLSPFSTTDLAEGTNLYWTESRFNTSFAGKTTSDLAEGAALFYTDERVRDAVAAFIQPGTGISWNHNDPGDTFTPTVTLAPFSTSDLAEGTNLYYTDARWDARLASKSTSDLAEGSNLYFTNARVTSVIDAQKGAANGLATLDGSGLIPISQLSAIAINTIQTAADQTEHLALVAEEGDMVIRTDQGRTYVHNGGSAGTMADYTILPIPTDAVISVNGYTGVVTLSTTDIGEGSNLYWTQTRFNTAFSAKSTTDLAEGSNLYYTQARFDSAFAAKSTTNLSEGTNLYWTQGRFDAALAAKSTSDVAEGSNLYFTNARVDARLDAAQTISGSWVFGFDTKFDTAVLLLQRNSTPTGVATYTSLYGDTSGNLKWRSGTGTVYTAATLDTNWDAADIVSGTLSDGRVAQSNVTQHQAALSLTNSQITDFATGVDARIEGQAHTITGTYTFSVAAYFDGTVRLQNETITPSGLAGYTTLHAESAGLFMRSGTGSLNRILTVADEGSGNGIDADTVDGQHGSYYLAWANLTGVPSTFAPSAHTHTASEITDFSTAVDARFDVSQVVDGNWSFNGIPQFNGGGFYLQHETVAPSGVAGVLRPYAMSDNTLRYKESGGTERIVATLDTNWTSADITDFNTAVDGRLDVAQSVGGAMTFQSSTIFNGVPQFDGGAIRLQGETADYAGTAGYGSVWALDNGNLRYRYGTGTAYTILHSGSSLAWGNLTGVPSTFAPSAHTHLWADITDKPSTFAPSAHTHTYSEITDFATGVEAHLDGARTINNSWTFTGVVSANYFVDSGSNGSTLYGIGLRRSGSTNTVPDMWGTTGSEGVVIGYDSNGTELKVLSGYVDVSSLRVAGYERIDSIGRLRNTAIYAGQNNNVDAAVLNSGTLVDARVAETNVTQHEAALSIGWAQLTGIPSTFAPSAHTHASTEITDWAEAVDDRVNALLQDGGNLVWVYDDVNNTLTPNITGLGTGDAVLGDNETVSGHWTFTNYPTMNDGLAFQHETGDPFTGIAGTTRVYANSGDSLKYRDGTGTIYQVASRAWTEASAAIPYANLTGVPSTFAPSAHVHSAADITSGSLNDGRVVLSNVAQHYRKGQNDNWDAVSRGYFYTGRTTTTTGTAVPYTYSTVVHFGNMQDTAFQMVTRYDTGHYYGIRRYSDNAGSENGVGWQPWHQIWTSGTDGAGSGLDADLLDGQHGSYYLAWANLTGVPSTFTPSAHTHTASEITDFNSAVDARLDNTQTITSAWSWTSGNNLSMLYGSHLRLYMHGSSTPEFMYTEGGTNKVSVKKDGGAELAYINNSGDIGATRYLFAGTSLYVGGSEVLNGGYLRNTTITSGYGTTVNAAALNAGSIPDARVPLSNVSQHQGSLSIGWSQLTSVPSTFTPSAHTHTASEITDFNTGVDARLDTTQAISGVWTFNNNVTLAGFTYVQGGGIQFQYEGSDPTGSSSYVTLWANGSGTLYMKQGTGSAIAIATANTNWDAGDIVSGSMSDARIPLSNVSQHQGSLSIGWSQLTGVPSTFAPSAHTHLWADITDKPATFTPSAHTHTSGDITDFNTAVDNRIATYGAMNYAGDYNATTNSPDLDTAPSGITKGDVYIVSTAGSAFFTATLEVGDWLVAKQDNPTLVTHWSIINRDIESAYLLSRANHTGTQLASTISDFSTAVDTRIDAAQTVAGQWTFSSGIRFEDSDVVLTKNTGNTALRIASPSGYGYMGALNTSHFHFQTDRSSFYFYKPLYVQGDIYPTSASYNAGGSSYRFGNVYSVLGNFSGAVTVGSINESAVTAHQAALSIGWAQLTSVPSTFTPSAHTLDSHSNVTITTIASGEILKWNGTAWINNTLAEAGIAAASHTHTYSQITDFNTGVDARLDTNQTISGAWTFSGNTTINGTLYMGNSAISGVESLTFNDSGPTEGVVWDNWMLVDSPNDVTTNTAGNLQIRDKTSSNARAFTFEKAADGSNFDVVLGGLKTGGTVRLTNGGTLQNVSMSATLLTGSIADARVPLSNVSQHQASLSIAWSQLTSVPSTFAPSAHTLDSHSNVTITGNTSGEILKWNGSAWVNNTLAEAGISATGHTHTAANITDFNAAVDARIDAAQTANSLWTFAAGVTLTGGALTLNSGSGVTHGNPRSMVWGYSGSAYGSAGYGFTHHADGLERYGQNDYAAKISFYRGLVAYSSEAVGTIGNTISWTEVFRASGQDSAPYFRGSVIWHAGNDGASSGLDSDLLDGQHGSYYLAWANLTGVPSTFAPSTHTHLWADITDKPTTFTPSAHTHTYSEITDFNTGVDARLDTAQTISAAWSFSSAQTFNSEIIANSTVRLQHETGDPFAGVAGYSSLYANSGNNLKFRDGTGTIYRVLTTADEGSGNGIDADTVDGIQGSSLVQTSRTITLTGGTSIDITGGTQNLSANRTWTVNHADTSTLSGVYTAGGGAGSSNSSYSITVDGQGHVTDISSLRQYGLYSYDNRAVNVDPNDYARGVYFEFRQNTADGLSDGGTYHGVMHWRSYGELSDMSGGYPIQLAYTDNNHLWMRIGTGATTWGSWHRFLTTNDEGSGNGIDADTVDGIQGASIVQTSRNLTLTAGTGISITGGTQTLAADRTWTISHADTSSVSNIDATTGQVIDTITFDTYGHVQTATLRALAAGDIPTLTASKISDFNTAVGTALDSTQTIAGTWTIASGYTWQFNEVVKLNGGGAKYQIETGNPGGEAGFIQLWARDDNYLYMRAGTGTIRRMLDESDYGLFTQNTVSQANFGYTATLNGSDSTTWVTVQSSFGGHCGVFITGHVGTSGGVTTAMLAKSGTTGVSSASYIGDGDNTLEFRINGTDLQVRSLAAGYESATVYISGTRHYH